jgi:predicted RNA-binding protein with PIN domain
MSLHFVLDGYNITNKFKKVYPSLSAIRQDLYDFIRAHRPQGSLRNKITVIFDGKSGFFSDEKSEGLEIIFSRDITADEVIKNFVKSSIHPKTIVVVTDDRDIQIFIRRYAASFMSVKDFLAKKSGGKMIYYEKNIISIAEADNITKELKKYWLDENS